MNQKAVRIIAIVLAVAIVGSVFVAAFTSALAVDTTEAVMLTATPDTGTDGPPVVPIVIGVVAVLLVGACVIIPKVSKK